MDSPNNPARRSGRIRAVQKSNSTSIYFNPKKTARRRRSGEDSHKPKRQKVPTKTSEFQRELKERVNANEAAQLSFLKKHRALFLELLPGSQHSTFIKQTELATAPSIRLETLQQPSLVKGKMKSYQLTGLSFLVYLNRNGMNGILGDEMGLGKTLQTLALLVHLKQHAAERGQEIQLPHLIVCPLSVLSAWQSEIKRWTSLSVCVFHGSGAERIRLTKELAGVGVDLGLHKGDHQHYDIVLTTYEAYEAQQGWFKYSGRSWDYVILDEGQRIKNFNTQIAHSLQPIRAAHRLILTGTPVQNNLVELWSLFHWLLPHVFNVDTLTGFSNAFNLASGSYNHPFLNASTRLLKLLMLRRTKNSVENQLSVPPREEITLYLPMSVCQRFWTKRLLLKVDTVSLQQIFETKEAPEGTYEPIHVITNNGTSPLFSNGSKRSSTSLMRTKPLNEQIKFAINSEISKPSGSFKRLMNLLMQLRKICNHPYLMPNSEPEPFELAEHLVEASSKLTLLDKLLASLLPQGKRVLIFSGFTRVLDILEDFLNLRSIGFYRLDGSTPRPRRALYIRLFQTPFESQAVKPIFISTTVSGGLGINLTAADTVVMYDSSWNPQVDNQAIARAHRIGQTRPVTVYRLVCADSVEEQMQGRIRKKLYLSHKIMNYGGGTEEGEMEIKRDEILLSTSELCSILRGGTRVFNASSTSEGMEASTEEEDEEAANLRSGYTTFLKSSFEDIVAKAREEERMAQVKMVGEMTKKTEGAEEKTREDEQEEIELLQGIERVRTRLFEGRKYVANQSNKNIGADWVDLQRQSRMRKERTTMVNGYAVENYTLGNARWEAVKTITSNPAALAKLQEPKRTKQKFEHEETCAFCHDGGELYLCFHCPRVAHSECMASTNKKSNSTPIIFACTQHTCAICERSTVDAGGMLYRCQTCKDAYCEDCLPEEDFWPVGEVLPEFLLLGYGPQKSAYFM
ncbi:hypothetical protein CROQUDRAFT_662086 [Cronartium quercuum f. sp. fusiforme G11]|uniref:Uncharacterized protein n=1 Tax=Cronartium quercuum f. sp. fusiforme G11 TaxID=708437 RepID=A0A9P6T8N6_9BASI|nr:hypothetical protein CROQUDRAFT_662086 [Cronartium quercuum f. sp. fusiforme G11]